MTNNHVFPFAALIALLIVSCKCPDTCPAFDTQDLTYIPYEPGHVYQYTNFAGDTIYFRETERTTSTEYDAKVKHGALGGCYVDEPCATEAHMKATAGATRNGQRTMEIALATGGEAADLSSVRVLDFSGTFDINNDRLQNGSNGYISASEQVGPHRYDNLLVMTADTVTNPAQQIWQVYFSRYGGVVGFRDRQTRSLFFLQ